MGSFSLWHWLIVGLVLLFLFGRGRFSGMMVDLADGIRSFRRGVHEDDLVLPRATAGDDRTASSVILDEGDRQ